MGTELKKYMEDTENYRRFLKLYNEIVLLNEKICDLRPVPEIEGKDDAEELKKKLQMHFSRKYKKRRIV